MLSAQANGTILLMYQENGHITKINEDKAHPNPGFVTVYGTLHSTPADTFQDITEIRAARNGPEGELRTMSFDDGKCYENNGTLESLRRQTLSHRPTLNVETPNLWCGTDVQLPEQLQSGDIYTLYWVWFFSPKQIYTTCIDILIVD